MSHASHHHPDLYGPQTEDDWQADAHARGTTEESPTVVPLYSESGWYREWDTLQQGEHVCLVQEGEEWTLLTEEPDGTWREDARRTVEAFLATHHLLLGE